MTPLDDTDPGGLDPSAATKPAKVAGYSPVSDLIFLMLL